MPILYNTGDWFTLGQGNTYRKFEIYDMNLFQNVELENLKIFGAPYGGPFAITKDPGIFTSTPVSAKPIIKIYTAAGRQISSITWKNGVLITMGWADSEELLCFQDNGMVTIFDLFGNFKHTFSMGDEAKNTKIIDAKVFPSSSGTGVAVMTTKYRIFVVNSITDQKIRQLPDIANPTAWEIITENRNTTCLLTKEKDLYKLTLGSITPVNVTFRNEYKSIIKLGISFNQKHLALYTNTGCLWMGSSDLSKQYCEFNTGRSEKPKEIAWIIDSEESENAHAIVVTYTSLLLVIGINGDSNTYPYDPAIFLIPEMDGVRVLSNESHEFIQKIPKCVSNIFAINSQEPSSFLYEAHKKFLEKSHQSDEYLCLVKDRLEQAVQECIDASCYEFDTEIQKYLIRTAYFGKGFINAYNPEIYIRKCRFLRVVNAIRHRNIGIPLTYNQFNHLNPQVILDRLVFRKHYGLAIQIAKHLKLSESRILKHWAYYKVANDKNDKEVVKKISEKILKPIEQDVNFCDIARKAEECGRRELAIMLLDLETKSNAQVPLLLKVGENKKALLAATKSGDTDLVYTVLFELKQTTQLADFLMIVRSFPMAQNLYKKYCLTYSKSALKDIYNQEDDFLSEAQFTLHECLATNSFESSLSLIANLYKKSQKDIEADLCEESKKLLKQQQHLTEKLEHPFRNLPVHDTVEKLLQIGDIKMAEKLKSEYKIPDKRFWWLRIQVLSEQRQWVELEKFNKIKKSPIGYEPFVEVCLKQNNVIEAKKYIIKCRDDKKPKLYVRAGMPDEAALVLFEQKDLQGLWNIHGIASKTSNSLLVSKVENYIGILSAKNK